tara:strand:- start:824 stop:1678 length:855 start_codon:yes stop_codon:yes gene_type:complete
MDTELQKLIQAFKKRTKDFILITGSFVLLGIGYALYTPQIYQATLVMIPNSDQKSLSSNIDSLASQFGVSGLIGRGNQNFSMKNKEVAEAILFSRIFIEKFIEDKNLMPILFADKWDEKNNKWKVSKSSIPKFEEAYRIVSKDIVSLSTDARTGIMTLRVQWTDKKLVADWANSMINMVNNNIRDLAISESEASILYLKNELESTQLSELKMVLYKLIEQDISNISLAKSQENYAFKILDPARVPNKRIKPKRTQIVISSSIFGFLISLLIIFVRDFYFIKNND